MSDLTPKPTTLAMWLDYIEALHPKNIALGLDRVAEVLSRLSLDLTFPVINIAGTNGKGSTAAMLEQLYLNAGYRVGVYSSPHFVRYNERVRINQQEVPDAALCEAFAAIEAVRHEVVLTYFEMGTLAAVYCFVQSELDVVILEVGMGGRLDAVNVFEPACSIVTSIDLDHMDFLGDTREKIGFEKAGVYREGKPAICGDECPPSSLQKYAEEVGANLYLINHHFHVKKLTDHWQYCSDKLQLTLPMLRLKGDFQLNNAASAIRAVELLSAQLPVALEEAAPTLSEVQLVGRFYTLSETPSIIVDVAHNPQAAASLAENLQENDCNGRTIGIFAMLADKDIAHVVDALINCIDVWYLADTTNTRGAKAQDLKKYLQAQVEKGQTACYQSVASALQAACIDCGKNDRIIVFGSFYTVADALQLVTTQGI